MLFTIDGQLNMQMKELSCYGSIVGGRLFVNLKQQYVNIAGEGVAAFRFNIPEKAFISKLEITTPEKELSTQYISKEESVEMRDAIHGGSPLTMDETGIFTAVVGVVNPQQTIDISLTYIQEVSIFSKIKITLPVRTSERLTPDFIMSAKILWHTAKGTISVSGTHEVTIDGNQIVLNEGYIPDRDITLDLRADESSLFNIYKGSSNSLLDTTLPFEPSRRIQSREYLFVVDTSKAVKWQWDNIKNALLTCISALNENESFNIVAFGLSPSLLSIGALKPTDSAKASAKSWLDDIKPAGSSDIGEALSFTYDLCSRKTEIFLITNSQFINANKILSEAGSREYASLNVINGDNGYTETALQLANIGKGTFVNITDIRNIGDSLCKALSSTIFTGAENATLSTDKKLVWHMENMGTIYPWDKIQLCVNSTAAPPEFAEITAHTDEELCTRYQASVHTKASDLLCAIYMANNGEDRYKISTENNIPTSDTELCLKISSTDKDLTFPICASEGGGTDKPGAIRKNALAYLAMQSADGSIGSPSETAGRIWEVMTGHPTPSIYIMQIKKAVNLLLDFVHLGEYDIMPERIIDVFDLWLEMFPSDTVFAKKIEALVYMNRK